MDICLEVSCAVIKPSKRQEATEDGLTMGETFLAGRLPENGSSGTCLPHLSSCPGIPPISAFVEMQHPQHFFQIGKAITWEGLFRGDQSSPNVLCLSYQHFDVLHHRNAGELWLRSNSRFLLFKTISSEILNKRKPSQRRRYLYQRSRFLQHFPRWPGLPATLLSCSQQPERKGKNGCGRTTLPFISHHKLFLNFI